MAREAIMQLYSERERRIAAELMSKICGCKPRHAAEEARRQQRRRRMRAIDRASKSRSASFQPAERAPSSRLLAYHRCRLPSLQRCPITYAEVLLGAPSRAFFVVAKVMSRKPIMPPYRRFLATATLTLLQSMSVLVGAFITGAVGAATRRADAKTKLKEPLEESGRRSRRSHRTARRASGRADASRMKMLRECELRS